MAPRGNKSKLGNLESLIAKGENPNGFTAQTNNGTAKATGTGWNKQWDFGPMPEAPAGGVWPAGRSTRTGE